MPDKISLLSCKPGITRDGTQFASRTWIDGQWVRFQRGLPKKIGGYKKLLKQPYNNIIRKILVYPNVPNFNVYVADFESVKYFVMDKTGNILSGPHAKLDSSDFFSANVNNNWKFETMFSSTDPGSTFLAYASQNLAAIDSTLETPIYYGDPTGDAHFTALSNEMYTSGGMVALYPFLFIYGNNGELKWTEPNDPTRIRNTARVTGSKIVAGIQTRAGNASPGGLFWSLDSLIRATYTGENEIDFRFDTISSETSILSSSCIIEYDGYVFWIGIDRFLMYTGQIQELPNNMSINYFFDNLNYAQRQKVWVTKITKFGEIWWFYPSKNSQECDRAIIYNIRDQTWYDTAINRSSGYYAQVFNYPIWGENAPNGEGNYNICMHEFGTNAIDENNGSTPIPANIKTSIFSPTAFGIDGQYIGGADRNNYLYRIEPDFKQVGKMSLIVNGRKYANSPEVSSNPYDFYPDTERVDIREEFREMSLQFSSNELDGSFEMGQVLSVVKIGDGRP
jgi:hypothetical protein